MQQKPKLKRSESNSVHRMLFFMGLPIFIYLIIFNYLPMFGIVIAFQDYNPVSGILGSDWVGFKNFKFFFESSDAWRTIRNTLAYNLFFLILMAVLNVVVALLWYELSPKMTKIYQTTMLIPHYISWVIAAYVVFALLSHENGLVNSILVQLGKTPINWYSEPKYWPLFLTIVHAWRNLGFGSILYYAALMGIDSSLFEAAALDGAGKFKQMLHVSLPTIAPTIAMLTILNLGKVMGGDFGLFFQIPRNSGALYATTDVISTYVYRGLTTGMFSQSAAVGLFQNAVGLVLVLACNTFAKKINPDYSAF